MRVEKERLVSHEREMAMIVAINKRGRNPEAVVFGEGHADTLPSVLTGYNKQHPSSRRRLVILKLKEK